MWDARTGAPLSTALGEHDDVIRAAISPDGKQVATSSADNSIHLWDVASGMPLMQLRGHQLDIEALMFSSDGRRMATGSMDNTVRVWRLVSDDSSQTSWERVARCVPYVLVDNVVLFSAKPTVGCPRRRDRRRSNHRLDWRERWPWRRWLPRTP